MEKIGAIILAGIQPDLAGKAASAFLRSNLAAPQHRGSKRRIVRRSLS
jgi:hypothetical protein